MSAKQHWETLYSQKRPTEVSWYAPHLELSLQLLSRAGLNAASRVIDVGAGASTLVDDVLQAGVGDLTVLDLSGQALVMTKARLGAKAEQVEWIEADVTQAQLRRDHYDLWHDRAAFHFLTTPDDRAHYIAAMTQALTIGGQAVIATFSLQGPPRCSGLEVVRYSPETLQKELGRGFRLLESVEEAHRTPFETTQHFLYCRFEKVASA